MLGNCDWLRGGNERIAGEDNDCYGVLQTVPALLLRGGSPWAWRKSAVVRRKADLILS